MSQVLSKKVVIQNCRGLHARAAAKVANLVEDFQADIFISYRGKKVSARSLMGLLVLAAHKGAEIELLASGSKDLVALKALEDLVVDNFHEENEKS